MAKRKYEFKPYRERGSLLDKLLLTRRQRLILLRWLLVAAVMVVLSLLQDVILCHVDIFGATTVLIPFAIVVFGFIYLFVADSIERKQRINNNNKNQ